MKQLDYLHLVSKFDGKTIRLPIILESTHPHLQGRGYQLILDTGADTSALTAEFLTKHGYVKFQKSGTKKRTATGNVELLTCEIKGLSIARQFKVSKIKVDVLRGWDEHIVVGVIGMDILSRMTFILSHEYKKFMLSSHPVPALLKLFV